VFGSSIMDNDYLNLSDMLARLRRERESLGLVLGMTSEDDAQDHKPRVERLVLELDDCIDRLLVEVLEMDGEVTGTSQIVRRGDPRRIEKPSVQAVASTPAFA
jgi:hypothetical protein